MLIWETLLRPVKSHDVHVLGVRKRSLAHGLKFSSLLFHGFWPYLDSVYHCVLN